MLTPQKLKKLVSIFVVFLLLFSLLSGTAYGAGQLSISTAYPGIAAQPGSSITFPLTVNGVGIVDLKITSIPKGWWAGLYGDGMRIHRVFVPSDDAARAELRVQIPSDVKNGDYSLTVEASAGGSVAKLPLNIKIDTEASGADRFEVKYPALSGPDTATYSFRGTLYNNSGRSRYYTLGADAPQGWQVSFKPAYENNQITSLSLEPGKSQDLDITVTPPKGVKAGKYEIAAVAVFGSEATKVDLEVEILGNYSLNLTTPSGRLNQKLTAGRKGSVTLVLENTGSADLQDIKLSSNAPSGWSVTFEPSSIEKLASGESQQVTAFVTPDSKAIAGDYILTLSASTAATRDNADIRVTVHTSTLWGLVGVAIVIGVVVWVAWTFKKYGRR